MLPKKLIAMLLIFATTWCGFIHPTKPLGLDGDPTPEEISQLEMELLEDILALDAKVLRLGNEQEALNKEKQKQKDALIKKRQELSTLDRVFSQRQEELGKLVRFSYEGGHVNLIGVLLGADSFGDLLRRTDNILIFMEYFNGVIMETRAVIAHRRQEELEIMENQRRIEELEDKARRALEAIASTLRRKQAELVRARRLLDDTEFLDITSEKWQEALPSLDYLLKNLSGLPWSSLSPDNLKVNYFNFTARAEFEDESLRKKLLAGDEKLKNVSFSFSPEGIRVIERPPGASVPIYSITCGMELTIDRKISFIPKSLEFNGITLAPKVIEELMADYTMVFVPPPLPFDLKIVSIAPEKGKLIMHLKR